MRRPHARVALALGIACAAAALGACGTSEQDAVRAVANEYRRALDADDGVRACRLLTPRVRANLADCPANVASIDTGDTGTGAIAIGGDRATVATPGKTSRMTLVRVGGSWRVDSAGASNRTFAGAGHTAAYERCWRAAGARIATTASDLAFAAADAPVVAVRADRVSAKGGDWRIFYTLPAGGRDPGLQEVIADPATAGVVAYVEHASAGAGIVERARACTGDA
jgi:hypothetical protein